ncbi:MAG: T9SS type A sorting domain-containing protein, partial [Bacteroidota bacterium]|nr:T9SS type A sorting domain-containing protein [Bacteroidota bacterium]
GASPLSFSLPGDFTLYYIRKEMDCACVSHTGVETDSLQKVDIYPNPTSNVLFIRAVDNTANQITLFDIASRNVLQKSFKGNASISLEHLSDGVYMYEISSGNARISVGKMVKE